MQPLEDQLEQLTLRGAAGKQEEEEQHAKEEKEEEEEDASFVLPGGISVSSGQLQRLSQRVKSGDREAAQALHIIAGSVEWSELSEELRPVFAGLASWTPEGKAPAWASSTAPLPETPHDAKKQQGGTEAGAGARAGEGEDAQDLTTALNRIKLEICAGKDERADPESHRVLALVQHLLTPPEPETPQSPEEKAREGVRSLLGQVEVFSFFQFKADRARRRGESWRLYDYYVRHTTRNGQARRPSVTADGTMRLLKECVLPKAHALDVRATIQHCWDRLHEECQLGLEDMLRHGRSDADARTRGLTFVYKKAAGVLLGCERIVSLHDWQQRLFLGVLLLSGERALTEEVRRRHNEHHLRNGKGKGKQKKKKKRNPHDALIPPMDEDRQDPAKGPFWDPQRHAVRLYTLDLFVFLFAHLDLQHTLWVADCADRYDFASGQRSVVAAARAIHNLKQAQTPAPVVISETAKSD